MMRKKFRDIIAKLIGESVMDEIVGNEGEIIGSTGSNEMYGDFTPAEGLREIHTGRRLRALKNKYPEFPYEYNQKIFLPDDWVLTIKDAEFSLFGENTVRFITTVKNKRLAVSSKNYLCISIYKDEEMSWGDFAERAYYSMSNETVWYLNIMFYQNVTRLLQWHWNSGDGDRYSGINENDYFQSDIQPEWWVESAKSKIKSITQFKNDPFYCCYCPKWR